MEKGKKAISRDSVLFYESGDKGPFVVMFEKQGINLLKVAERLNALVGETSVIEVRQVGFDRLKAIFENGTAANKAIKSTNEDKIAKIRAYIPMFYLTTVGVVEGIPMDADLEVLKREISCDGIRIIAVERMKAFNGKELVNLEKLKITFRSFELPEEVRVKCAILRVRIYIPKPTFCSKCLSYGHYANICKNEQRCHKCTKETTGKHECGVYCKFCKNGSHYTNAKDCPEKIYQIKIKTHMLKKKCTFREAKSEVDAEMNMLSDSGGSKDERMRENAANPEQDENSKLKTICEAYKDRTKKLTNLFNLITRIAFNSAEDKNTNEIRILEEIRDELDHNQHLFITKK